MSTLIATSPDEARRECARRLAEAHRRNFPEPGGIYLASGEDGVVRSLEIVPDLDFTGSIYPVGFPPDPEDGIDLPSAVILVHPKEWDLLHEGSLSLPSTWGTLESLERIG